MSNERDVSENGWTKRWEMLEGATFSTSGELIADEDDISIVTGCTGEGADWDYSGEIRVTGEGAKANARLCLASPALAEALELAVYALGNLVEKPDYTSNLDDMRMWAEDLFLPAARAALRLARGES